MIYEIINPSDPYTIVADDFAVAAVAICLLGRGAYGLQSADGTQDVPIMLFGRDETWFPETFGKSLEELLSTIDRAAVAACLESIVLCTMHERRTYDEALAIVEDSDRREMLRQSWMDERRTSLHDIGRRALKTAKLLRVQQ